MYAESTLKKYTEDLASKLPAPGGGSAAAYCGALGAAAMEMVCSFTVDNDKYKSVHGDIKKISSELKSLRQKLVELVDKDVSAYQKVASAQKIPKEEKEKRTHAMQEALKEACSVPLEVCRNSHKALKQSEELAEKGNKNLITDVGVGLDLLVASFSSAKLNVDINLKYIFVDDKFLQETKESVESMEKEVNDIQSKVSARVKEIMTK